MKRWILLALLLAGCGGTQIPDDLPPPPPPLNTAPVTAPAPRSETEVPPADGFPSDGFGESEMDSATPSEAEPASEADEPEADEPEADAETPESPEE